MSRQVLVIVVLVAVALLLIERNQRVHGSSLIGLFFPNRFQRARRELIQKAVQGEESIDSAIGIGRRLSDIDAEERQDLFRRSRTSRRAARQVLADLRNELKELAANKAELASGRLPTEYGLTIAEMDARSREVEAAIADLERCVQVL